MAWNLHSLGEVLAAMNTTFEQASRSAPCILFIDEVDNIGNRGRSDRPYDDYWSSLVNRVLELLDGASKTEGVIVMSARPTGPTRSILRFCAQAAWKGTSLSQLPIQPHWSKSSRIISEVISMPS
jgi:hypothetical protein